MFAPLQTTNSPDLESISREAQSMDASQNEGHWFHRYGTGPFQYKSLYQFFRNRHGTTSISIKLFFHLLLLICAASQLFVDNNESDYLRSARRTWFRFFFPPDYVDDIGPLDMSPPHPYYLYTAEDVDDTLRHALHSYETIVAKSLDTLAYFAPGEDPDDTNVFQSLHRPDAILTIKKYISPFVFDPIKTFDSKTETESFAVNSTNLGVLDDPKTRMFLLRRVVEMVLRLKLVTIEPVSLRRSCLVWNIELVFSFRARGQMSLSLNDKIEKDCDDTTSSADLFAVEDLLWLNLVLIGLSIAYFVSIIRHVTKGTGSSWLQSADGTEVELDMGDIVTVREEGPRCLRCLKTVKLFCNFWVLSDVVALFCILISSSMNIAWNSARRPTDSFHTMIIGLGNGLLWVNLVQYFSHNKTYFALILTLERSVPKVFKFLLGVAPIFMGYSIFGVAYFGAKTVRFAGMFNAFVSLFSLLNGDAVSETFRDLIPFGPIIAQLYLYSFILLWTYVVLNILIAIVEESFFTSLWSSGGAGGTPGSPGNGLVTGAKFNERMNEQWFRANRMNKYRSADSTMGINGASGVVNGEGSVHGGGSGVSEMQMNETNGASSGFAASSLSSSTSTREMPSPSTSKSFTPLLSD